MYKKLLKTSVLTLGLIAVVTASDAAPAKPTYYCHCDCTDGTEKCTKMSGLTPCVHMCSSHCKGKVKDARKINSSDPDLPKKCTSWL